jgi:hypothetical protein
MKKIYIPHLRRETMPLLHPKKEQHPHHLHVTVCHLPTGVLLDSLWIDQQQLEELDDLLN